jgi:Putative restriction endonuclease
MGSRPGATVVPRIWSDDAPPIRIPVSATTHAGFRAWATSDAFPERLRASFINQEIIIDMSPEELETHNKVKTTVVGAIDFLNRRLDLGELFSDRTLVSNRAAGLSTEPDATFVSWSSFDAARVRLVPRKKRPGQYMELEGTPDWVLEVVSQSSVAQDTEWLRVSYPGLESPSTGSSMHGSTNCRSKFYDAGTTVSRRWRHAAAGTDRRYSATRFGSNDERTGWGAGLTR